jgi:hypothetical protein
MTKHKVVGGTVLCSEAARQVYKTRLSYFNFCTVLQRGGPPLWSSGQFMATDPEALVRFPALPEKKK